MKKDVPLCINFLTKKTPYKGPSADSEEKHEPVSDIDTAAADGLKVLHPKRPIREADINPPTSRANLLVGHAYARIVSPHGSLQLGGINLLAVCPLDKVGRAIRWISAPPLEH